MTDFDPSFDTGGRMLHLVDFAQEGDYEGESTLEVLGLDEANVISSVHSGIQVGPTAIHYPVIDLDVPARLIPSSTPGHSHLYIDVPVSDPDYWKLISLLSRLGIVEVGYAGASERRGFTSVRLPWVKKEEK